MKTTNYPMKNAVARQMHEKISIKNDNACALVVARYFEEMKEAIKHDFDSLECAKSTPKNNKQYDLVMANPTLSQDDYIEVVTELFKLVADNGQLITICLDSWIKGQSEAEMLFRLFVEANGYYEDIDSDEANLILLILSK